MSAEEISVAVEWLRLNPPKGKLPLKEAIKLGRQGLPTIEEALLLNKGSNTTFVLGRGATYALARLDRDRPDLAESVSSP